MISWLTTALGLLMISNAKDYKQVAIGGVVASVGANMVAHDYRETSERK